MIKNIFEVNNEEKSRILNLHENATKNLYLSEDTESVDSFFLFPPTKEEIKYGKDIVSTMEGKGIKYDSLNLPDRIAKLFAEVKDNFLHDKNPNDNTYGRIGKYFKKHTDIMVPEY